MPLPPRCVVGNVVGNRGFSLLELVMVLTMVGILVAVSGPRWPGGVFLQAQAEQLAQDIRTAQALAMGQEGVHTIQWLGTNSYGIVDTGGRPVLPYPLVLEGVIIQNFMIAFDVVGSAGVADKTINLYRGADSCQLTVVGLTGAVTIRP